MDVKIYNPIVKINISVFLINMLKVYTNSHPASHKDTNKTSEKYKAKRYFLQRVQETSSKLECFFARLLYICKII